VAYAGVDGRRHWIHAVDLVWPNVGDRAYQMLQGAGVRGELSNGVLHGTHIDQFTGLHDKRNQPIYDGDLISFTYGFEGDCVEQVFWNEDEAKFMHTHSDRPSKAFWANDDCECEVIGNVYENRDLIEREAEP
jgi:hypothetical protein